MIYIDEKTKNRMFSYCDAFGLSYINMEIDHIIIDIDRSTDFAVYCAFKNIGEAFEELIKPYLIAFKAVGLIK